RFHRSSVAVRDRVTQRGMCGAVARLGKPRAVLDCGRWTGTVRYRGRSRVRTKYVLDLYEHGRFANRRLLEAVATLTPEEFPQSIGGSYGSVRTTLVHLLGAEWGWLARCGGPERGDRLKPESYPTLASVVALVDKVEGYERDFLPTLNDADLMRVVEFSFVPGQTYHMT